MENLKDLSHLFVTVFLSSFALVIVVPGITDVTMLAICPGQVECSLAIYLSGLQQAIIGVGTVVAMPVIGNLSDQYGRKALLTFPLAIFIIPMAILAYSRTTNFFYAYYALRTLTAMVSEGSINCLALAYMADIVPEGQRTLAFGILTGISTAAYVCGTFAARFISTTLAFQVATCVSMLAVVYMRLFLKESVPINGNLTQPILNSEPEDASDDGNLPKRGMVFKRIPSVGDLICLLKTSTTFWQAAVVAFFDSLANSGMMASVLYYLKARFLYNKNQYADLMLLMGIAGTISQLLCMPLLSPFISEEKLLSIGLFAGFLNSLLYSIAWSAWVPYAATVFSVFVFFVPPCLRSIASKQVGPHEQGKAQGCISGIISVGNIIAPLIFSPLTALFLSEEAPFKFPGFCILCIGLTTMVAFVQSVMMRSASDPVASRKISSDNTEV